MKVLLLFTFGVSLNLWKKLGIIDREILLYKKLAEKNVEFTFLTFGGQEDLKVSSLLDDIKIIPTKKLIKSKNPFISFLKALLLPIRLRKVFKSIDIIKTNQLKGWWIGGIAKLLYKKPLIIRGGFEGLITYILDIRSRESKNYIKYIFNYSRIFISELLAYKFADKIILTSDIDIDFIIKIFKLKKKRNKIHHFYNYIDIGLFRPLNIEKREKSIIFVGKLSHQKNISNLIKALNNLYDFNLTIVGGNPFINSINKTIIENHTKIDLLGILPNRKIPKILNQHEIFILPSYSEGNPKALLEAMSCGVPCIGTNVKGINNIIKHNITGFLCKLSSSSISKAILTLYNDKPLRDRISKNARDFVVRNCSLDSIVSKEFLLYKNLLKEN